MSNEFLLEVYFIKIRVKGYIENPQDKSKEIIDTKGIKNNNKITYLSKNVKTIISIKEDKIIIARDSLEYSNEIIFIKNKTTKTEYFLKNYNNSLFINIFTRNIIKTPNSLKIIYQIENTNEEFIYYIEMENVK